MRKHQGFFILIAATKTLSNKTLSYNTLRYRTLGAGRLGTDFLICI